MISSKDAGAAAERLAESYLRQQGLKPIERNFRCRSGEIDLIMRDKNSLVFVEVRFRKNADYGGPLSSIDSGKCKRLLAAAHTYLQQNPRLQNAVQRFDVVGICGEKERSIEWLQNAIEDNI